MYPIFLEDVTVNRHIFFLAQALTAFVDINPTIIQLESLRPCNAVYKIYYLYRSAPHYFLFFNIEEYLPSHSIFGFLLSNQCHLQILQTDILAHGDQNLLLLLSNADFLLSMIKNP